MGNFVVAGVVSWLLNDYFLAQGTGNAASEMVVAQARLPAIVDGTQLTIAFLVALAIVAAAQWWLSRTTFGYELRMVGANPRFARAQGIDIARIVIVAMVLSGALGGLAGSTFTLGTLGRFVDGAGANLGFNGIAVALLGRLHPLGALVAALALGALAAAGPTVQLFIDVPLDVIRIMQGTIMIAAVIPLVRRPT
jgi:general nucleoside transport system permease protein